MLKRRQSFDADDEIIINFSSQQYPFPSIKQPLPAYFKTIQMFIFTTPQLEKLTSVHHKNLVNLKRIVKTNINNQLKDGHLSNPYAYYGNSSPSGYFLYYQPVQRGVHNRKKLSQGLNRLAKYLIQNGIFYEIRECDIGYDQFGQIKVFIPPFALLSKTNNSNLKPKKLTEQDVYESINRLINSNVCQNQQKMDRINHIDQQLKQIKKQLQIKEKQNQKKHQRARYHEERKAKELQKKESNMQNISNSKNYFDNQFLQEDIQQQILNFARNQFQQHPQIQEDLNITKKVKNVYRMNYMNYDKYAEEKRQSMPHQILRSSGLNDKKLNYPIQMINWISTNNSRDNNKNQNISPDRNKLNRKFQQNINCINIYHNTKPEELVQIQQKPSIIVHHYPTGKKISAVYDQVSDSLDTYELQIGQTRQMPKMVPRTLLRHTVLPSSQRNNSAQASQHSNSRRDKKKWIYGSAGHKQFAQLLKHTSQKQRHRQRQMPPRKSNIYEQSVEESMTDIKFENNNDISLSLVTDRQTQNNLDRTQIKNDINLLTKNNPMYNSQINDNKYQKSPRNMSNQNDQRNSKYCISINKKDNNCNNNNANNSYMLARKKSEDILEVGSKNGQIHNKVNQAVLKTKAAIQLLRKVRHNANGIGKN